MVEASIVGMVEDLREHPAVSGQKEFKCDLGPTGKLLERQLRKEEKDDSGA